MTELGAGDHQDPRKVLRARFLDAFEMETGIKQAIQEVSKRNVPHTDSAAQAVSESRALRCPRCVAIAWMENGWFGARVFREWANEAWVRGGVRESALGTEHAYGFIHHGSPIVNIGMDEGHRHSIKGLVRERKPCGVSQHKQLIGTDTSPGNSQLIRREVDTNDRPARLDERRDVYSTTTADFQAAAWPGAEQLEEQWCPPLVEIRQVLAVPIRKAVVARQRHCRHMLLLS